MTGPGTAAPGTTKTPSGAVEPEFVLRLFITGQTSKSTLALENLRRICETHLTGRYKLEVVDIYQDPDMAAEAQIIAAPTLIKLSPEPLRRIIGDLSDENKVLTALGLRQQGPAFQ